MSKFERNKDTAQELVASTAEHVGEIAKIITAAVADITKQIGDLISDGIEMREAAKQASRDEARDAELAADGEYLDVEPEEADAAPDVDTADADIDAAAPDTGAADADVDEKAE